MNYKPEHRFVVALIMLILGVEPGFTGNLIRTRCKFSKYIICHHNYNSSDYITIWSELYALYS